jgi:hypothetical protein
MPSEGSDETGLSGFLDQDGRQNRTKPQMRKSRQICLDRYRGPTHNAARLLSDPPRSTLHQVAASRIS